MKLAAFVAVVALTVTPAAAQPSAQIPEACRSVPEAENHLAALLSPNDVLAVEELNVREHRADATVPAGDGARLVLAAHLFVTADWLQRVIVCHLAHNAALGRQQPATTSPLDVAGAIVNVTSKGGTMIVDITAVDRGAVREIRARARGLDTSH
jgi:hypothetical protein